ncbi:hypothetical protein ACO0LG_13365 [Undibacterium sp. Ji42W]|uniref:hypothetical protein n=1 Tax=Undibacterium sp. Ji42W TaxID=3413039 RepID=UPI003BF1A5C2
MQYSAIASSSANAEPAKHLRLNAIRLVFASTLLAMLTTSCAQSPDALAQGNGSSGTASSSTSIANKKSMETNHQNASPEVPQMTAEEISKRMLDLMGKIKTAEDISAKNLEIATGLKVYVNADNPDKYAVGAKITDTWFFNIKVISGSKGGKSSRLIFSFDDQTHSDADMTPICKVDFDAYLKRLTELGFQSEPYYGEHNRLIYWNFSRGKVELQISLCGESNEKATHKCVSMIVIDV